MGSGSALMGTWQILNLDSAGYSSDEINEMEHVRIRFGADGTYRRIIRWKSDKNDSDALRPAQDGIDEGRFVLAGDTVKVHWLDPSYGGDYSALARISRDTLFYSHAAAPGPIVAMTRIPDSATLSFPNIVPYLPVPDSLVALLRHYRTGTPCLRIVKQLYGLVLPDSSLDIRDSGFLRVIVSDLDSDSSEEIIALTAVNQDGGDYYLLVLKHLSDGWQIIYDPVVYYYYEVPPLRLVEKSGSDKTFYTFELTMRGSGIHRELIRFFKLIDGRVYEALTTVHECRMYGWGRYLNQDVDAELTATQTGGNRISVSFTYGFFPGAVFDTDVVFAAHPDIPFVKGKQELEYEWRSATRTYAPLFTSDRKQLTAEKVACLSDFTPDLPFVEAFQTELQETRLHGSKVQAKLITEYLRQVKENGVAVPPSGELEEKTRAGGSTFYGPKKK